jgi:hypothetical protein
MPTSPSSKPRNRPWWARPLLALCACALCAPLEACSSAHRGRARRQRIEAELARQRAQELCLSPQDHDAVISAVSSAFNLPERSLTRLTDDWQIAQAGEMLTQYGRWGWRWLVMPKGGVRSSPLAAPPASACVSSMLWTGGRARAGDERVEAMWILEVWGAPPLKPEEPLAPLSAAHPRYPTGVYTLILSGVVHATRTAEELSRLGLRPLTSARAEADIQRALTALRPFRHRRDTPPPPPPTCPISPDLPAPPSSDAPQPCAPLVWVQRGVAPSGGQSPEP